MTIFVYTLLFRLILAAKIEIWTSWNCCAPHAPDGSTNRALDSSWANWYHLPQIMHSFARIARRRDLRVFGSLKPVSSSPSRATTKCGGDDTKNVFFFLHWCAAIPQMCVTAIANLQQAAQKKGKTKYLFNKDEDIIPFMEQYWEAMTTMPRRVTQSW